MPWKDPAKRRANVHRKEHNREYMKQYRAKNPDYMQQWRDRKKADPEYMERKRSQSRAWYYTEKGQAYKERYKLGLYGLTEQDYNEMLAAQDFSCAICRTDSWMEKNGRLHIDHDHDTGQVRGLLCSRCNVGIGMFAEAKTRLLAAIEYLEKHSGNS